VPSWLGTTSARGRSIRARAGYAHLGYVAAVTTFALIRGSGGSAWDWHQVAPVLAERGHDAVVIDLPLEDESAGRGKYTDAVVKRRGERLHNLGGPPHVSRLQCLYGGGQAGSHPLEQAEFRLPTRLTREHRVVPASGRA
jgi:hypothetical protein